MEKKCANCRFCRLDSKAFCEWTCTSEASPRYDDDVELFDSCACFEAKKENVLNVNIKKEEAALWIRALGKANEKAYQDGTLSADYHDGYLDALTEILVKLYG